MLILQYNLNSLLLLQEINFYIEFITLSNNLNSLLLLHYTHEVLARELQKRNLNSLLLLQRIALGGRIWWMWIISILYCYYTSYYTVDAVADHYSYLNSLLLLQRFLEIQLYYKPIGISILYCYYTLHGKFTGEFTYNKNLNSLLLLHCVVSFWCLWVSCVDLNSLLLLPSDTWRSGAKDI